MQELLKELHGIDTDKLGELQYLQGRLIGKLEAYIDLGYEMTESEIAKLRKMIDTYLYRNNILVSPRLKTEIVISSDGSDNLVADIPGFGRWLLDNQNEDLFAIGFLPDDEPTLKFESYAFFWHDWMEDLMKTEGITGYSLQYEYVRHYLPKDLVE